MRDICCIVGSHPKTRQAMDFNRTDCDIWIFNEARNQDWCKRFDAVFQMHSPVIWRSKINRNDPGHYEWLQQSGDYDIWMQDKYEDVPNSKKFPLDELCDELLGDRFNRRYFTSSVSYAIALAIYLGYKQIELVGVEMETNTEYVHQRDGVTFWTGLAIGRGIKVIAHSVSIMVSPLYGYEGDVKISREHYTDRIEYLKKVFDDKEAIAKEKEAELNRIVADYTINGGDPKRVIGAVQEHLKACNEVGIVDGAVQENQAYLAKADKMIAEVGDYSINMQEYEQKMIALTKARTEQMDKINGLAFQLEHSFKLVEDRKSYKRRHPLMSKFEAIRKAWIRESMILGVYIGAGQENVLLKNNLSVLIRMAGGEKAKEVMEDAVLEKVEA